MMPIRLSSLALMLAGAALLSTAMTSWTAPAGAQAPVPASAAAPWSVVGAPRIVAMRRLSEAQYRHAIADIFGPDITVAGRFEPIGVGVQAAAVDEHGLAEHPSHQAGRHGRAHPVQVACEQDRPR